MSRLTKNIFYNLLGQFLLVILGFVAVKYVFRHLGGDALGIIYFTLTLNTILAAVLELGISSVTVREVSSHFTSEPVYIRELIRTFSLFYWTAYLVLALVIYYGAPILITHWIHLETMDPATATEAVRILGISAVIVLPRMLYASLFVGLQRMEFNNGIDVVTGGLQQLGAAIILVNGGGFFDVVWWMGICFVLSVGAYIFFCGRFFPWRALVPGFSSGVVRRNFTFACNMTSITILAMILTQIDKLMVSKFLSVDMFGFYGFISNLVSRMTLITNSVAQALFPSFSILFKDENRERLMKQYRQLHNLICLTTIPVFAVITFASVPMLSFLFNEDIARMLFFPITLLCVGYYMNGTLSVPCVFSYAVGRPDILSKANLYALFIMIPLAGVLIYAFGLTGAALSWVLYHVFAYAYMVPKICSESLRIPASEWYYHIVKIFMLTGVSYGMALFFIIVNGTYTAGSLGVAYSVSSLIFLVGAYQMNQSQIREFLSNKVQVIHSTRA